MRELTILMPCLNEAETLAGCIDEARAFLTRSKVEGEVLIADNGSTDGSIAIAEDRGATVVRVPARGYGAALIAGIRAASGRFVVIGDSDGSYDFGKLDQFLARLRAGADLVMGNRFRGGIAPSAMPFLHRYLGNPVLSFIGRMFFFVPIGDFHCGLRAFARERILALGLVSPGMEFASEMVVRAAIAGYAIEEVPTTLSPDGRSRPPHLRTWRDGWRHLRFLLLFCPRWLFFYPGLILIGFGAFLSLLLLPGPFAVTPGVALDVHSLVVGAFTTLIGLQAVSFAVIAQRFAVSRGFLRASPSLGRLLAIFTLERVRIGAAVILLTGIGGLIWSIAQWVSAGFGPLEYGELLRVLTLSMTGIAIAFQLVLTAFLGAMIEIE